MTNLNSLNSNINNRKTENAEDIKMNSYKNITASNQNINNKEENTMKLNIYTIDSIRVNEDSLDSNYTPAYTEAGGIKQAVRFAKEIKDSLKKEFMEYGKGDLAAYVDNTAIEIPDSRSVDELHYETDPLLDYETGVEVSYISNMEKTASVDISGLYEEFLKGSSSEEDALEKTKAFLMTFVTSFTLGNYKPVCRDGYRKDYGYSGPLFASFEFSDGTQASRPLGEALKSTEVAGSYSELEKTLQEKFRLMADAATARTDSRYYAMVGHDYKSSENKLSSSGVSIIKDIHALRDILDSEAGKLTDDMEKEKEV